MGRLFPRRLTPVGTLLWVLTSCSGAIEGSSGGDDAGRRDAPTSDVAADGAAGVGDAGSPDASIVDAPLVDAPVADAPLVDAPVADAPAADAPVGDVPVADAPAGDVAVDDASNGCDASCSGRACGDDGCGHSCGSCPSGQVCQTGACACDPTLPAGWPSAVTPWPYNPMLVPTASVAAQGADNVYAPDILEVVGVRVMWYGGQGLDGHDQIFLAWSSDGAEWRKYPSDAAPAPVLARGASNHVNDPSVVAVGGGWRMYYTDAPTLEDDRIWLAESATLAAFSKTAEVLGPGPAGSWDGDKVGRPSVLLEGGVYRMWYDGSAYGRRHVGLATSTDGLTFVRYAGNPVFLDAGAVDVKRVGGVYVMLRESGDGTYWATSVDGICWVDRGRLFGLSGAGYDAYGQVTPFLDVAGDVLRAVWFGGASVASWNKNRIAVAYPQGAAIPPGAGCTACVSWGLSCSEACQAGSQGAHGACGTPGSASPERCCACGAEGCEACVGPGLPDCHAACVNAGRAGGRCASPGSLDPGACCACLP